jgi:hypothetical protein
MLGTTIKIFYYNRCVHGVLVLTIFLYLNVMQYFRITFKRIIDSIYSSLDGLCMYGRAFKSM